MTRRVCYLARADRGDQIAGVRLVGEQTGGAWLAPEPATEGGVEASSVVDAARGAAGWLGERLGQSRWIDVVCIDGEGAVCSWLSAPSAEASVVEAAFAQGGGGVLASSSDAGGDSLGGGTSVQALGERVAAPKRGKKAASEPDLAGPRLAVLAVHDTSARLFLDALDDLGIGVGRVVSLWHALAEAWDVGAPDGPRSERVVATEAPVVAVVLADPVGRLAWAWSHEGTVLTGGSLRLARAGAEEGTENGHSVIAIGAPDIGRLTADWLAWAAQLGRAPARVVCIVPGLADGGMTAAQMGEALGRAWPTATVDLVVHSDPVGATLGRLVRDGGEEGASEGLTRLTTRPSRAHRALHLWGALALAALAGGLAVVAIRLGHAARGLSAQRELVDAATKKAVQDAAPDLGDAAWPERALQAKIDHLKGPAVNAGGMAKPVLSELEAVVGLLVDFKDQGVEPLDILVDENMVSKVDVNIPASAVGEDLLASAQGMPSSMIWTGKFGSANTEGKQRYSLLATWPKGGPAGGR